MKYFPSGLISAVSKFIKPIALTASFLAVSASAVGVWYGVTSDQRAQLEQVPVVREAEAVVEFIGGERGYEHLNPKDAIVVSSSEYGELKVLDWTITVMDDEAPLLTGAGEGVAEGFSELLRNGSDGEYEVSFTLQDAYGGKYKLSRNFYILIGSESVDATVVMLNK